MKGTLKVLILFLMTTSCFGQERIYRIAGDSMTSLGFSGDNGPAINSKLDFPTSVSSDTLSNVYIVDSNNNRIRKIFKSSGIIKTIAGGGSNQPGNGDTATLVNLNSPTFMYTDRQGNHYLSESGAHVIRRIDGQTNIITTIAGTYGVSGFSGDSGAATSATLTNPMGISIDEIRNYLYISDGTNRIRRVDLNTGVIVTVVGTGTTGLSGDNGLAVNAQINTPLGIAIDNNGNVFFSDLNHRIRRIDFATGIITGFAGTSQGYGGDNGPAITAALNMPYSIAFDMGFNNLYIADFGNSMIRKIQMSTDTITRIAGNGNVNYSGDGGPALYSEMNFPSGICASPNRSVYLADTYNNLVREIKDPVDWPYHPFPDSNVVWNFHYDNLNSCSTTNDNFSIVMTTDTLINTVKYHKLNVPYVMVGDTACTYYVSGYKGAVRQDTSVRRVYYIPPASTTEYLLYDFKMQVGDTIKGYIELFLGSSADKVYSIDSVLVGSSYRKRWKINNSYGIYFIEGVGSTYGLIEQSVGELIDVGHYYLTCFIQNGQSLYPFPGSNCQTILLSNHSIDKIKLAISPNPTGTFINISYDKEIVACRVYDIFGNRVKVINENLLHIDVKSMTSGVYFLEIVTDSGTIRRKFVKE